MSLAVINLFFFVPDLSCCAEMIIFFGKKGILVGEMFDDVRRT